MANDPDTVTEKVKKALVLIGQGWSKNSAAREVGLPKSTFYRALANYLASPQPQDSDPPDSAPESGREQDGRFAPGNKFGTGGKRTEAIKARRILEEFTPDAARDLIETYRKIPPNDFGYRLAFLKEILDRGLGKPKQVLDLTPEIDTDDEYRFVQEVLFASPELARAASDYAHRLEEHARESGGTSEPGQVDPVSPST